jgi:hypothetical protein
MNGRDFRVQSILSDHFVQLRSAIDGDYSDMMVLCANSRYRAVINTLLRLGEISVERFDQLHDEAELLVNDWRIVVRPDQVNIDSESAWDLGLDQTPQRAAYEASRDLLELIQKYPELDIERGASLYAAYLICKDIAND